MGALKGLSLVVLGAFAGFGLALAATHFAYGANVPTTRTESELGRFGLAFERVRDNYLSQPEDRQLVENAIGGMLSNLDAHSSYFDPRAFAAMETKAAGAYGGIGVVIALKSDIAEVVSVVPATAAFGEDACRLLHRVEDAVHVHGHHALPRVVVDLEKRTQIADPGLGD